MNTSITEEITPITIQPTITYTLNDYVDTDRQVQVTYANSQGFEHKRYVNIPHLEDGAIDESYFQEILEGQLMGVVNKVRVGIITFTDPNAPIEPVGIATTS